MKIGKEKGKRKRKGISSANRAGGNSAQSSVGVRGHAGRRPTWPASGGERRRDDTVGAGPHARGRGRLTVLGGVTGGEPVGARPPVRSAAVLCRVPVL
jgi:hypothetical protein